MIGIAAEPGAEDGLVVEFGETGVVDRRGQVQAQRRERRGHALGGLPVPAHAADHHRLEAVPAARQPFAQPARLLVPALGQVVVVGGAVARLSVANQQQAHWGKNSWRKLARTGAVAPSALTSISKFSVSWPWKRASAR